ncbi:ABATE domain-containing protein, partial [Curtobacterium pusillum]
MHTGQHIRTDTGSTWFFDAGRIALDFAHTGGFADDADGRRPRAQLGELLVTPADLDEWLSDHTEPIDVGATARELQDARALRAAIARLAVAAAPGPSSTAAERTAVAAGLRA